MRISDWSSDVCSSDLHRDGSSRGHPEVRNRQGCAEPDSCCSGTVWLLVEGRKLLFSGPYRPPLHLHEHMHCTGEMSRLYPMPGVAVTARRQLRWPGERRLGSAERREGDRCVSRCRNRG